MVAPYVPCSRGLRRAQLDQGAVVASALYVGPVLVPTSR